MKLIILTILAVFATASTAICTPVLSIFPTAAGSVSLTIPPQVQSFATVGQTITILIEASGSSPLLQDGPSDLYGYSFDLSFNPSDLQVVPNGIQEDGYFAQNGTSFYYSVDNTDGLISNVSDEISGPGPGENLAGTLPFFSGADVLASITFQAIEADSTSINFINNDDLYFVDSQGNFTTPLTGVDQVTTFGTIVGRGAPPPVPEAGTAGTVGMAGIGLLAIGYCRRTKRLKA